MQKYIDFHTSPPVPLVVAHRGARGHAPENTLTAAALGYAVQADLWELDANYTKDGKLVVMHDDTLVRTTDVETAFPGRPSYRVCDFTLDEIKSLDAGSWYAGRDQFGRVAAGEIDADTLKSFDGRPSPPLRRPLLHPRTTAGTSTSRSRTNSAPHRSRNRNKGRVRPHPPPRYGGTSHHFLVPAPLSGRMPRPVPRNGHRRAGRAHTPQRSGSPVPPAPGQRLPPGSAYLAPGDLAALRDAGFAVNVWTVNDMSEAKRLVAEGATGIITDFPAACRKALGE